MVNQSSDQIMMADSNSSNDHQQSKKSSRTDLAGSMQELSWIPAGELLMFILIFLKQILKRKNILEIGKGSKMRIHTSVK